MAKVVYRSRLFNVERFSFRNKKGKIISRDRIISPDTVIVLPILSDGKILLERQYRHAVMKYLYELPAGHIDPGESPREAAARELEEETGYRPGRLSRIYSAYVAPGGKTELQTLFIARDLRKTRARPEEDEIITLKAVTPAQALRMVRSNAVRDMKTMAALLFYVAAKRRPRA